MICIDRYALASSKTKYIVFPDIEDNYAPMFLLADGHNLRFHNGHDHETRLFKCAYLDEHHFNLGLTCFHRDQFAELMHRNGHTYEPETFVTDLHVYHKFFADRRILDDQGKPVPYHVLLGKGERNYYGKPAYVLAICPAAEKERQVAVVHSIGNAQAIRFCSYDDLEQEIMDFQGRISFPCILPDPNYVNVQFNGQELRFLTATLQAHGHELYPKLDAQIHAARSRTSAAQKTLRNFKNSHTL